MHIYRAIIWIEEQRPITRAESIRLYGARSDPFAKLSGTFQGRDIRILAASDARRLAARVEKYADELDHASFNPFPIHIHTS